MGCMVEENGTVVSPVFEVSSLAEVGDVSITCSWERCATPNDPKCVNVSRRYLVKPVSRRTRAKRRKLLNISLLTLVTRQVPASKAS